MEQHNTPGQGLKRRRQLLLVLPLLILPFMTLAFWALGGGQQQSEDGSGNNLAVAGINPVVPGARSTVGAEDKMTLYAEADRQAAAAKQSRIEDWGRFRYPASMDRDSTYENGGLSASAEVDRYGVNEELNNELNNELNDADPNSLKIRQKLADLQAVLARAETVPHSALALSAAGDGRQTEYVSGAKAGGPMRMHNGTGNEAGLSELQYLKDMIAQSADVNDSDDTREINAMLDKILAIQHPTAQSKALKAPANAGAEKASSSISPVTAVKDVMQVPLLLPAMPVQKTASGNGMTASAGTADDRHGSGSVAMAADSTGFAAVGGASHADGYLGNDRDYRDYLMQHPKGLVGAFYDIDAKDKKTGNEVGVYGNRGMAADIAQTQTLVSGGTVKMRLNTDVIIHGRRMPKGSFVFGACRVNGERLKIDVRHIRLGDQLFSVQLKVFDLDGMEGIHIPGSISRDAAKQGADRGLSRVQMMSLDPSVAAQAATAGMEAAKGLLSKKVKLVRITVKAGYPILLLNSKGLQ